MYLCRKKEHPNLKPRSRLPNVVVTRGERSGCSGGRPDCCQINDRRLPRGRRGVSLVVRAGPESAIAAFLLGHWPSTHRFIGELAVAAAHTTVIDIRGFAWYTIATVPVPIAVLLRLVYRVGGAMAVTRHAARGFASSLGDGHRCTLGLIQQHVKADAFQLQMALQALGILVEDVPAGSKGRRLSDWDRPPLVPWSWSSCPRSFPPSSVSR